MVKKAGNNLQKEENGKLINVLVIEIIVEFDFYIRIKKLMRIIFPN